MSQAQRALCRCYRYGRDSGCGQSSRCGVTKQGYVATKSLGTLRALLRDSSQSHRDGGVKEIEGLEAQRDQGEAGAHEGASHQESRGRDQAVRWVHVGPMCKGCGR